MDSRFAIAVLQRTPPGRERCRSPPSDRPGYGSPNVHLTAYRQHRSRPAGGVRRGHATAAVAGGKATVPERLRDVATDVKAIRARHIDRLIGRQLANPFLDLVGVAPGRP